MEENGYSLASMDDPSEEKMNQIMTEAAIDAFAQGKRTNGEFLMSVRKSVFNNYNK